MSSEDDSGSSSWDFIKDNLPDLKSFLKAFPVIGGATATILVGSDNEPGLLTDPKEFVFDLIETWVVDYLITPLLDFIVEAFAIIADSLLYVAFGQDRMVGNYASIGIVDIPTYFVTLIIAAVSPAGSAVLGVIGTVNTAIASVAAKAGIAAPVVIPALQIAWVAVAAWVLVTIVSAIDIPGVRLVPLLKRLLSPARALFGWFR